MHESSIEIGALDNKSKVIPLILGPLLALALYFILPETYVGAKGDTVSNVTKPAKLETGIVVQVPIFVNEGDRIKVDTRTKEYLGRE